MPLPWPRHLLTIEEWDALPEDEELSLELVEGVLTVVPTRGARHQYAVVGITHHLDTVLPPTATALARVEVALDTMPATVRVPDAIVTRTALVASDPRRFAAADVLLAIEILSDGTRKVDRILKFAEYAEAGIGRYWLIDIGDPVTLTAYVLVDGTYELSGEHTGRAVLDVAGHPVTLDLPALVRR